MLGFVVEKERTEGAKRGRVVRRREARANMVCGYMYWREPSQRDGMVAEGEGEGGQLASRISRTEHGPFELVAKRR